MDWGQLPEEVVVHILRLLDHRTLLTVALVSKKLYHLSQDNIFWRHLRLDAREVLGHERCIRKLLRRCTQLKTISITDQLQLGFSNKILPVLAEAKDSLRHIFLAFSLSMGNPDDIKALSPVSKLEILCITIENVDTANTLASDVNLTGLKGLILKCNYSLNTPSNVLSLDRIFKCVTNLTYVHVEPIDNQHCTLLAKNNPNITVLHIHKNQITDETLRAVISYCPKLQNLKIKHKPRTLEMVCALSKLRVLYINGENTCEDSVLKRLVERNPDLEELHMCGGESPYITKSGIANMLSNCEWLWKVEFLFNTPLIEDDDIEDLQEMFPDVEFTIL